MEKAIIISDSLKATEFYQDFLQKNGCHTIKVVDNGAEAKRSFVSYDYDVCIINTPLHSDMCEQLSIDLAEQNTAQVILFVKSDCMDEMTERVENYGILTVEKPINKQMFWSALKFSQVISRRIELCNEKIKKLQRQLEELKTISKAKCILIEKERLTEQDAHKYIEKQAMNQRVSRYEVAEQILCFYTQQMNMKEKFK